MRLGQLSVLVILVFASSAFAADFVVFGISDPYKPPESSIEVISPDTWAGAQSYAQSKGGQLMSINSAAENQWVVSNILTTHPGGPDLSSVPLWIGLYDPQANDGNGTTHTADFIWSDGSTSTYRNWHEAEPNNTGGTEYYTAINWHYAQSTSNPQGDWNDAPVGGTTGFGGNTDGPYYALVELPEPTTAIGIIGAGAMFLLKRKR